LFGLYVTASLHIEYPMLFELHNDATQRTSHSGVLEFVAEEGMIIMPYWVLCKNELSYCYLQLQLRSLSRLIYSLSSHFR
jgi:hypothetical protein